MRTADTQVEHTHADVLGGSLSIWHNNMHAKDSKKSAVLDNIGL
jgi:hypothetical protein